jgi:hypothetical protein
VGVLATTAYPVIMGAVMAEVAAEVLVALVRLVVTAETAVRQEAAAVGLVLALVQA